MKTDMLTDAVLSAVKAVRDAIPSQAPSVAVSGVRKTATGTRPVRGLITSCTISSGFSDPLGELAASSADKLVTVLVPKRGEGAWFDATDPLEGDGLTFEDGERYAVVSVSETRGLYYKIGARRC